jgi:hypothetical protein
MMATNHRVGSRCSKDCSLSLNDPSRPPIAGNGRRKRGESKPTAIGDFVESGRYLSLSETTTQPKGMSLTFWGGGPLAPQSVDSRTNDNAISWRRFKHKPLALELCYRCRYFVRRTESGLALFTLRNRESGGSQILRHLRRDARASLRMWLCQRPGRSVLRGMRMSAGACGGTRRSTYRRGRRRRRRRRRPAPGRDHVLRFGRLHASVVEARPRGGSGAARAVLRRDRRHRRALRASPRSPRFPAYSGERRLSETARAARFLSLARYLGDSLRSRLSNLRNFLTPPPETGSFRLETGSH